VRRIQIEVAEAFEPFLQPARFKGSYGGRGSGKSWFWAGETVKALLSGKNVLCIREVQNSIADSVKRLIEGRIDALGLADLFEITDKEIRCPRAGSVAIFRGMMNHTAASVKSLEGFDRAWWEEAQTASQRSLDLLIPTIRAPGSELWFSWNPEGSDDPIEFLRRDAPEGAIVRQVNWNDNPWFPEELRADMDRDRNRDPAKYSHIWEGAYRALADGQVFRNWRVGEMSPPDNVVWFYGADWGFAQDATAAVRCCIPKDGTIYIDAEVYGVGVPTDALPGLLAGLPDAGKWPMRGDSARPETIDYLRRHGFPRLRAAHKGKGSVEDGIAFLQGMDIVVHPNCVNLIRELKTYSYKADPRTQEILPVVMDGNDHVLDALRYACEGLHRRGKMVRAPEVIAPDVLERPRDYQSNRREAEDWKTV
jgi:phage terminase large subunit